LRFKFFNSRENNAYKRLVLRNGGNDSAQGVNRPYTHIRDALVHILFRKRNPEYAYAAYQPVHLFLNGAYWGIYNLRERQDQYYFRTYYDESDIDFLETTYDVGADRERRNAVEGDWIDYEALIDFVQHNDLSDEKNYAMVESWVDVNNLVDYWIFEVYCGNLDWPFNNMKMWRPRRSGAKWRWVLWDTEMGFGVMWRESYNLDGLDRSINLPQSARETYPWFAEHRLMPEMIKSPKFREIFATRFFDCLNSILRTENVHQVLDSLQVLLAPDIDQQLQRWNGGSVARWNNNLEIIKTYTNERPDYLKTYIRRQFDLNGLYTVRLEVEPFQAAKIEVNSIVADAYPWEGQYAKSMPLLLQARPACGYRFKEWQGIDHLGDTLTLMPQTDITIKALFELSTSSSKSGINTSYHFRLKQNYPNPFNPATIITYQLPIASEVELSVYNLLGQKVITLELGKKRAGQHQVEWNAKEYASGIYIYRIKADHFTSQKKMLLLK
jgi:hypothetical protein